MISGKRYIRCIIENNISSRYGNNTYPYLMNCNYRFQLQCIFKKSDKRENFLN